MTPRDALAQALDSLFVQDAIAFASTDAAGEVVVLRDPENLAERILAALPEGWALHDEEMCVDRYAHEVATANDYGSGASDERRRLLLLVGEDDEASSCVSGLHTHAHGFCNGRAFVRILGIDA